MKVRLSILIFLTAVFSALSQTDSIRGTIRETFSNQPLAFVHITIQETGEECISSIDGNFTIPYPPAGSIVTFERYLHRTVQIEITETAIPGDTLLVKMNRYQIFPPLRPTNSATETFIRNAIDLTPDNNINNRKKIAYQTYNKLTIDVGNNSMVNDILTKLRKSGWIKIDNLSGDQHLYILESAATRKIMNEQNQLENIDALKSSGVRIPGVALLGTHLQHFNIYDNFVDLAGKQYISPIAQYYSINRYHYEIIDTLHLSDGIHYAIAFAPKANKNFSAIKGIMMISAVDYSVRYVIASPAFERKGLTEVSVSYTTIDHELYPERQTIYLRGTQNVGGLSPVIKTATWYHYYRTNQSLFNHQFDERILSYTDKVIEKDTNYWNSIRQTPATITDKNTYNYFYNGINTMLLQRFLNLGQNVYFGKLTIDKFDFDLNKVLNHNRAEGLRIGLGGTTNYKFSEIWQLSGFVGYGIDDSRWKYGFGIKKSVYTPLKCYVGIVYSKELEEAGGQHQSYDMNQYSSESLRRLLMSYMDYTDKYMIYGQTHPLTYLDYNMAVSYQHTQPNYIYAYKGDTMTTINYLEWTNGIRYAFGEQVIEINNEEIRLQSAFPVVYLNIDKGFKVSDQPFHYTRYEFKIDQFIKIVELGKLGIQLAGGTVTGEAPYSKLFAGKGSRKAAGVVVHNSFETMAYNEFAANKYVGIFLSHDFGRMYYRSPFFMPNFMAIYNIGWGFLSHASDQAGPSLKSYNKGYKEFGGFLNNILVLKVSGLKMGLGAGIFFRYGEYQLPKTTDNALFKFSLNLSSGS